MSLGIQDKAEIERVGYVVFNSEGWNAHKEDFIYKVKEVRVNSKDSISVYTDIDSEDKANNGCNANFFRLATPSEVKLYKLSKEPVHINQLDIIGDLNVAKKDQLISEAKVRGFVKGAKVILPNGEVRIIESIGYDYYEHSDTLYTNTAFSDSFIKIYHKGKWIKFADSVYSKLIGVPDKYLESSTSDEGLINWKKPALKKDWYKKVRIGDWIRCTYDLSNYRYSKGVAWELNKEYEVLHTTFNSADNRLIFVVNEDGSGVFNTACVPIEKSTKVSDEGLWAKIKKSSERGSHPLEDFTFQGLWKQIHKEKQKEETNKILPMKIVRRKRRKVGTEILESKQIVDLVIKKRKKR